jgi:hypothetical protein
MNKIFIALWLAVILASCTTNSGDEGISTSHETIVPGNGGSLTPMSSPVSSTIDWWHPTAGLTWQWQLGGALDFDLKVNVWDIDLGVHKSVVDKLHTQGAKVICYISVGSYENWRLDAGQFPEEVLGKKYEGWSGERWLDIRRIDLLAPIMLARLDECAAKGFDAVEPDNMEVYTNDTGFPLTYDDQLRYALWLAEETHQRGLAIGQKNAPDQTKDLVSTFDFAITEDAFYFGWTGDMLAYIQAGKPVFAAEYTDLPGDFEAFCRKSKEIGFSTILKHRDLRGWLQTCP